MRARPGLVHFVFPLLACSAGVVAACSGSSATATVPQFDASAAADSGALDAASQGKDAAPVDAPAASADTGMASDGGAGDAARNAACTPTHDQTGTAVTTSHGRLDGTLVYVVDVGQDKECNGDDSHVHLQVEVSGSVYDIAVDIGTAPSDEVGLYQDTLAIPDGTWAEGWHGADSLGYPSLGLHSTSFPIQAPTTLASQVEGLLAGTTKISVFCTGYSQGNGCHDVHYEHGDGDDGAIVLNPTAATSTVLFFRFQSDTF